MFQAKYQLHNVNFRGTTYFCIWEHETEQVVGFSSNKLVADNRLDFLVGGGAFNGFTPRFMVRHLNKES